MKVVHRDVGAIDLWCPQFLNLGATKLFQTANKKRFRNTALCSYFKTIFWPQKTLKSKKIRTSRATLRRKLQRDSSSIELVTFKKSFVPDLFHQKSLNWKKQIFLRHFFSLGLKITGPKNQAMKDCRWSFQILASVKIILLGNAKLY